MKPSEILEKAHELLSKPGAWCQDSIACNRAGKPVLSTSKHACSWCLEGATCAVDKSRSGYEADEYLRQVLGVQGIFSWNDHPLRTIDHVLSALRTARQMAIEAGE